MIHIRVITLKQLLAVLLAVLLLVTAAVFAASRIGGRKTEHTVSPSGSFSVETESVSASLLPVAARGQASRAAGDRQSRLFAVLLGYDPTDVGSVISYTLAGAEKAKNGTIRLKDEPGDIAVSVRGADELVGFSSAGNVRSRMGQASDGVFLYHSHTTEAYADSEPNNGSWRSKDPTQNMLRIGDVLAEALLESGVSSVQSRTYHEDPNYNYAYARSLETVRAAYRDAPDTALFLDVHRDAWIEGSSRPRAVERDGVSYAQLQFVIGCGTAEDPVSGWEDNLALAEAINARLEKEVPGIVRSVRRTSNRYNQFAAPTCLLVEIGHNENTLAEAERSAGVLARAIAAVLSE